MRPDEAARATTDRSAWCPPRLRAAGPAGAQALRSADERLTMLVREIDLGVPSAVESRLEGLLAERVKEAHDAHETFGRDIADRVARFALGGGRRIRPQFLWWGMRAAGLPTFDEVVAALRLGSALELIQTCALIHDDVMDGSPSRRGHPAVHVDLAAQYDARSGAAATHFGESAAVLAGDLALAWADDELAALDLPAARAASVRAVWAQMRMEMVAGQYLDVQGEVTRNRSVARSLRAAYLKTALYTVERPLQLGTLITGVREAVARALCAGGRNIGLAFQLRNDLVDVLGYPQDGINPVGADVRSGKPTYLIALAQARAEADGDHRALAVLRNNVGRPDLDDSGLDEVRQVIVRSGASELVLDKIGRLHAQSIRHLAAVDIDPVAADRLQRLMGAAAGKHAPDIPREPARRRGPVPTGADEVASS
ncbi:polyprenyl synthetase family protein [Streptomyces xanthochromogenes]|uniref:polyprenyl synthetase family protein n=1 Tax=Streptomyces xanthochromogenes TaxID=67384 RepID=UPI0034142121